MNKYLLLMLVFATLATETAKAQKNRVFLGQKNIVEANYAVNMTILTERTYFVREGSVLDEKKLGLQHGLQLAYTRHLVGQLSFGLEFDYTKTVYAPDQIKVLDPFSYQSYYYVEKIDADLFSLIGKFEFGRREGVFPIGVSHQVGGGLLIMSPKQKSGELLAWNNYYDSEPFVFDYTLGNAKGMTIFYNLNFRAPLSDRLLLNFGLRYNFNYMFPGNSANSANHINEEAMARNANGIIGLNVMRLYTGLSFSF